MRYQNQLSMRKCYLQQTYTQRGKEMSYPISYRKTSSYMVENGLLHLFHRTLCPSVECRGGGRGQLALVWRNVSAECPGDILHGGTSELSICTALILTLHIFMDVLLRIIIVTAILCILWYCSTPCHEFTSSCTCTTAIIVLSQDCPSEAHKRRNRCAYM